MILYPAKASEIAREFSASNYITRSGDSLISHVNDSFYESPFSNYDSYGEYSRVYHLHNDISVTNKKQSLRDMMGALALTVGVVSSFGGFINTQHGVIETTPERSSAHQRPILSYRTNLNADDANIDEFLADLLASSNPHLPAPNLENFPAKAKLIGIEYAEPPELDDDLWSL